MADRTRVGALARRCLNAIRAVDWNDSGSYRVDPIEYVSPYPPPPGDLFSDPVETARLLEQTRQSILNRPCLCGEPTCGNVGCPRDGRTYLAAIYCGCWPGPDGDLTGTPSYAALHPYDSTKRGCICLFNPEDAHA